MFPARSAARQVVLAPGEVKNLTASPGHRCRTGSKLALVQVIHRHRFAEHRDRLDTRHPVEVRVGQERVVALDRGEVVSVGIAVTLGIESGRISCVRFPVGVLVENVVVQRVDDFACVYAPGEVPH